ncbi:MAG: hypothetical protein AAFY04_00685 [Pseudomonadota bacterium]
MSPQIMSRKISSLMLRRLLLCGVGIGGALLAGSGLPADGTAQPQNAADAQTGSTAEVGMSAKDAQPRADAKRDANENAKSKDRDYLDGLVYRNIGPWRGGRANAIAGSAAAPFTFYLGTTGGVFKTTNAGVSWAAVSDEDFNTAPIGALAVAPSNPNIVVAGTGESAFRGVASSQGDGVYRSVDGGASWQHVGLKETRQIGEIVIHPTNPDIIWVAAQGDSWAPNSERGVYKSVDGGKNWRHTLTGENENSGAVDLRIDPTNPLILYAAMWDHEREPWQMRSGGPGSGIWKSTDGGENWSRLTDDLPETMGKIGIAPSGAKPGLVFAVIEAGDKKGGVYKSTDYGDSWTQVNKSRKVQARSWYYMHIFADPKDAETVYVMNADFHKSTDGGKSFTSVPDRHTDHHDVWINPENPNIIANANDGGGNISLDGAASWSEQHNQPTAQFYRVITDNQVPYRLYAGQQDNSTVSIPVRGADGAIGRDDYFAVGGGESAHVALDPDNPRYIYAGSYLGYITEYDTKTRTTRYIAAYPELEFGVAPSERKYRWNWNAPIVVSAHDPKVIYHGGNHVMVSRDRGQTWAEHSPDLTRDEEDKQGPGGLPITNEVSENYNTILYLADSPHKAGILWAGTDDGRLQVTRDDGKSWADVTPAGVSDGMFNAIEVSPHNAGTAYVAFTRYKMGDQNPYIYQTSDYGKTWSRRDSGLPDDAFVRVVREDVKKPGLLFAGTEKGVFYSSDAGANWASLRLEMPSVPITDLRVKARDLVVATQGRGFWILDDIAPLREMTSAIMQANAHLFTPQTARRFETGGGNGGEGANPPRGAVLYYALVEEPDLEDVTLTLEILDAEEKVIRTLTSDSEKGVEGGGSGVKYALPTQKGLNRVLWDMRSGPVKDVPGLWSTRGGEAKIVPGYRVGPGKYSVRLKDGDKVAGTVPLTVTWDPRLTVAPAKITEQQAMVSDLYGMIDELYRSVVALRVAKEQADLRKKIAEEAGDGEALVTAATTLGDAVDAWEKTVVSPEREFFQDVLNYPDMLDSDLLALYGTVDGAAQGVTGGMKARMGDLRNAFKAAMASRDEVIDGPLAEFNAVFSQRTAPGIALPPLQMSASDDGKPAASAPSLDDEM